MPRGDGTGPLGTGPIGRGRGGCRQTRFSGGFGFGRGMQGGFFGNTPAAPENLEAQADRLESQAANLRKLAKQDRKSE
ncbi:MAG: DUF5320 domain-containing protein [Veillonellales bacterium]